MHSPLVIDVAVAAAYQVLDSADPLDTAAELVAGYHAVTPLEAEEFDLLFDLIAARLVTTVVISSWRTTLFPENRDYLQKSMPAALRMLERFADVSRESAGRTFRQACRADGSRPTATAAISSEATETAAAQRRTTPQLIAQRKRLLGPAYRLFYDRPLHLVRGEGVWLYDADGRAYLDVYNNVPHVGHCHPRVVEAIARQAGTLNTHTRYLHETVLDYTERLTAEFPDNLSVCMFCCTGSEANELALRIARAWTGGEGVIVSTHAYHGNTNTMIQLSTSHAHEQRDGDRVKAVSPPDTYRGQYRRGESRVAERYAAQVQEAIEQLQHGGTRLAALFLDTVFTSDGILAAPHGYLAAAVDYVHAAGGLFVADEVQPGFGRLGETMWGFEAHHVVPDIVTLGKPIGNGHPLAAVVTTPEIMAAFARHGRYFNTFGGNPVSCAAGLAVLDVLENEQLQENAAAVGAHLKNGLQQLQSQHELIGDVRGSGFVSGVELVRDSTTLEPATTEAAVVVNGMRDRGVLIGSTGADGNVLKIRPPMVFSAAHADRVVATLDETLCSL